MIQAIGVGVAEHLESGRLIEVLPALRAVRRPVSIMYPNRQHLPPPVRALIDWIAEVFATAANDGFAPKFYRS